MLPGCKVPYLGSEWFNIVYAAVRIARHPYFISRAPSPPHSQIGLVEALHDHLKGKAGSAPMTLGAVLQGQAGKSGGGVDGVCADREGVLLKTALLYLSSQEVRGIFSIGSDDY